VEYFTDHSLDIHKFRFWTLALHSNQSYLGRAVCYLNTYKEQIIDLTPDEQGELFEIMKRYQTALSKLWQPDWWNYAQQGNVVSHLHLHFVPRYNTPRTFEGMTFTDERWGKNYAPAPALPENKELNEKVRLAILGALE